MNDIIELIKTGNNEGLARLFAENSNAADGRAEDGLSLLQLAAYYRNVEAVRLFREYKQHFDIFEAACAGEYQRLDALIREQPNLVNTFSSDGFTALGLACFFGHYDCVKLLLNSNANPNIAANNAFKVAPIHSACAISNYEIAELLLKNGANPNALQQQNITPLHSAAHHGQTKLTELLLDFGANIHAKMEKGQTPLAMALENNHLETADLLKQEGAI